MVTVLHIAQNSKCIEEAILVANRVSKDNHLLLIKINGETRISGGMIFPNTPRIRAIFSMVPPDQQHALALELKTDPWSKSYADPSDLEIKGE